MKNQVEAKEKVNVTIKLTEDMLGTVAKNKEIYSTYIESKKPNNIEESEVDTVSEELEKSGWTGFHSDEKGLFIYNYMVKGFLKNAGNILKEVIGVKALRSKINDYVFIHPRRIYLNKKEPDGVIERPIRVMTLQGPRVALIKSDYVKINTLLDFEITLIKHKEITTDIIIELLKYGEEMGLGQFRNGGYGSFTIEKIY